MKALITERKKEGVSMHYSIAMHPGSIIKEYITELNLSVTDTAKALCTTRKNLSEIINGKVNISPIMACKLSKAFDTTPEFWMDLQSQYDLAHAKREDISNVKQLWVSNYQE